jgi:hypothetical protein
MLTDVLGWRPRPAEVVLGRLTKLFVNSVSNGLDEHARGQTPVVQQADGFVEFNQRFSVDMFRFEWL